MFCVIVHLACSCSQSLFTNVKPYDIYDPLMVTSIVRPKAPVGRNSEILHCTHHVYQVGIGPTAEEVNLNLFFIHPLRNSLRSTVSLTVPKCLRCFLCGAMHLIFTKNVASWCGFNPYLSQPPAFSILWYSILICILPWS